MADNAEGTRKSCLRRGCIGCLVVFAGFLVLILGMAVITLVQGVPDVVPENDTLTHVLPDGAYRDGPSGTPLVVGEGHVGRVVLDVSMASFTIVPAPPGSELRLEADYNAGPYKLVESMRSDGELGWTYRLEFGQRSMFQFIHTNVDNRLELHLPAGTPLVIEGQLGIGESDLQLGGLWIERLDLEAGIGEHRISFDQPLAVPMKSFRLTGSIGEMTISGLGNASPAQVDVRHRIGEVSVDLDGAWRNDAVVVVRGSIGGYRVGLPDDDVAFELQRASVGLGEASTRRAAERPEPPPGAPVVRLEASNALGELFLTR